MTEVAGGWPRALVAPFVVRNIRRRYAAWGYTAAGLDQLTERMRDNLAVLARLLGDRPYLLGRTLTLGDLATIAQVVWMRRYAEARLLEPLPAVTRWLDRIAALPAVADALPS